MPRAYAPSPANRKFNFTSEKAVSPRLVIDLPYRAKSVAINFHFLRLAIEYNLTAFSAAF
jgi:hypothetical protein